MVKSHQIFLIILFVGNVEEQAGLERALIAFEALTLRFVVEAKGVETGGLVNMIVFVEFFFSHEFIVDLDSFLVVSVVEIHIGEPFTVLDIDLGEGFLILKEGDSAHPIALACVVFQLWNFLFLLFHSYVQANRGLLILFSL